jgi:hypothetical protein
MEDDVRIRPLYLLALGVLIVLSVALAACGGNASLLSAVKVTPDAISPNGDGAADVATISYRIGRPSSSLSITLTDEQGKSYVFRHNEPRSAGDFQAQFSGVVETALTLTPYYTTTQATVLPDGIYKVTVTVDNAGQTETAQASLSIKSGDNTPPGFGDFSVFTPCIEPACKATHADRITFTPNRDGIEDRIAVSYWLTKEATVEVYLLRVDDPKHTKYPIAPVSKLKAGRHDHDYEGGVDLGNTPPPDGEYLVVGEAKDTIGNDVVITRPLTIANGGVPLAQIVSASITPLSIQLNGLVRIEVVVENVGTVAIRSQGPYSGTIYTTDENYNQKGFPENPGVFRVEADFEGNSAGRSYPFRWGLSGDTLLPGQRQTIVGYIKVTTAPTKPSIYFWVGLQHEQVAIVNDKVTPTLISIGY